MLNSQNYIHRDPKKSLKNRPPTFPVASFPRFLLSAPPTRESVKLGIGEMRKVKDVELEELSKPRVREFSEKQISHFLRYLVSSLPTFRPPNPRKCEIGNRGNAESEEC
jgi:hypothetical protein